MARASRDPKVRALREARSLNPRPEAVRDEQFSGSEFLDARDFRACSGGNPTRKFQH